MFFSKPSGDLCLNFCDKSSAGYHCFNCAVGHVLSKSGDILIVASAAKLQTGFKRPVS